MMVDGVNVGVSYARFAYRVKRTIVYVLNVLRKGCRCYDRFSTSGQLVILR